MPAGAPHPDANTSKQRNRRSPYTTVACDQCRQRKSKCSGDEPCRRCREYRIACCYPRTTRYRSARRNSLAASPSDSIADAPSSTPPDKDLSIEVSSDYSTASSTQVRTGNFDYYLQLVENNFGAASSSHTAGPDFAVSLVGVEQIRQAVHHRTLGSHGGALAAFAQSTWMAVLQLWQEEVGLQYPLLDTRQLGREIDAAKQEIARPQGSHLSSTHQHTTDIALMILAILSSIKDASAIEVADTVVREIHAAVLVQVYTEHIERECLVLLILIAVYEFLVDREVLAWRTTGTVLRLLQELDCQESGGQGTKIDDNFFWTVYTLDRRWSFGTGLPFAISDADITRQPTLEDESLSSAYLTQMISYCNIASEVRTKLLNSATPGASSASTRDFLEFRVLQWQQNLPEKLRFRGSTDKLGVSKETRGEYRLRLILYLRANQMRLVIHRKFATRQEAGNLDSSTTRSMSGIARDTIHVLLTIAHETDIYYAQHKTFNHFLETALSSLLLILCSSQAAQYPACLRDVLQAMGFIGQLSKKSPISKRLRDKLQNVQQLILRIDSRSLDPSDVYPTVEDMVTSDVASQGISPGLGMHLGLGESAIQVSPAQAASILNNSSGTMSAVQPSLPGPTADVSGKTHMGTIGNSDSSPDVSDAGPKQPTLSSNEFVPHQIATTNAIGDLSVQRMAWEKAPGLERAWPSLAMRASSPDRMDFSNEAFSIFGPPEMAAILQDYDSFFF